MARNRGEAIGTEVGPAATLWRFADDQPGILSQETDSRLNGGGGWTKAPGDDRGKAAAVCSIMGKRFGSAQGYVNSILESKLSDSPFQEDRSLRHGIKKYAAEIRPLDQDDQTWEPTPCAQVQNLQIVAVPNRFGVLATMVDVG